MRNIIYKIYLLLNSDIGIWQNIESDNCYLRFGFCWYEKKEIWSKNLAFKFC